MISTCSIPLLRDFSTLGVDDRPQEECRAECVGLYLCVEPSVLAIFGHGAAEGSDEAGAAPIAGSDIVYVNWLNMARAGLLALQFYTPTTQSWGQAHMQARYAILRV